MSEAKKKRLKQEIENYTKMFESGDYTEEQELDAWIVAEEYFNEITSGLDKIEYDMLEYFDTKDENS